MQVARLMVLTRCPLLQDEVEIVHQEGDEATRQADVEDKIIRQVDQLVEYFNSLFQDDQLDIRCAQHRRGSSHAKDLAAGMTLCLHGAHTLKLHMTRCAQPAGSLTLQSTLCMFGVLDTHLPALGSVE